MANSESEAIREFRKAVLEFFPESHVFKVSDRHMTGIADQYVKIPNRRSRWIEWKFEKSPKREDTKIPVRLTPPQRRFLTKEIEAGGSSGWIVCVAYPDHWRWFSGADPEATQVSQEDFVAMRKKGKGWTEAMVVDVLTGI